MKQGINGIRVSSLTIFKVKFRNMKIYLVLVDTNGAHEADCLYSVWNNKKDAEKEAERLNKSGMSLGCYGGKAGVQVVEINKPYNEWHDLP